MCGVAAVVGGRIDAEERLRLVQHITRALAHRGPDGMAWHAAGRVALGHTRLRVVDPRPEADQPMTIDGCSLVFSGAIMNHRALRRELEDGHGVRFRTCSDTEVLLQLLRRFGEAALTRTRGMFSFVYHDARTGRVLAARDRMGIKPLTWTRRPDGVVLFASEARALVHHGEIARAIDFVAFRQLLRFNHPLGDQSFFKGVHSLEPGCLLSMEAPDAAPAVRRWWSLRLDPQRMSLDEATEELDAAFRRSMTRAVDVDVPHGAYLSGGVDSSGLAADLAARSPGPRLYSLVMPGVRYSEEQHVDRVARALDVRSRKVALTGLTLADFVAYAERAEMPQWWTSDLALGALAGRARRDGTAVILSGEGPDELFAGYEIYRIARLRPLLVRLGPLLGRTRSAMSLVRRLVPWLDLDASVASAYLDGHAPARERALQHQFGYHPENVALWEVLEQRRALSAEVEAATADYPEWERTYFGERLRPAHEGLTPLEKNLHFELTERLPKWILHMGDRMSSAHGIEVRFPYLDDDFVATSLRLPVELRATLWEDKRALRRLHRRRLPRAITSRRKQPLYTPTAEWIGPVLADPALEQYWSRAAFERAGLLRFEVCDQARARLAARAKTNALTDMVDEWLFCFALMTNIAALDGIAPKARS